MKCPSYPENASHLEIGRRNSEGVVVFHEHAIERRPIESVRSAQSRTGIEYTSRFAGPCATSACINWDGKCRLGLRVSSLASSGGSPCSISEDCRWYTENGVAVCHGCRLVVYVEPGS